MIPRKRGKWAWVVAAIVLALAGIGPLLIVALDAGYLRGPLLAYLRTHFDRPISIEGPMQLQLWSAHPRIVAQQVTIGNPPWVAAGDLARIERLTLVYEAPRVGHAAVLQSIALEGASLHLLRDATGHANWQHFNPDSGRVGKGLPLIRDLSAKDVQLQLDDQRRHLQYEGTVTAQGQGQAGAAPRLHLEGKGQLNGKAISIELNGDPLAGAQRDVPYAFELTEESSGSRLDLHGSLPQPFDFKLLDATFEAAGADLKDLYFLTGLKLLNTGAYRLTGSIARRGASTSFDRLKLTTGQSDLSGSLENRVVTSTGRSSLAGSVTAGVLHLADFGARAAGLPSAALLFSEVAFNPEGLRRSDAQVRFEARRVDLGRNSLQSLSGQMNIDHGVVTVSTVQGNVLQGKLEGHLTLDANKDLPTAKLSMKLTNVQLADLEPKQKEPPVDGLLQVRIDLAGQGASLHAIAASANGSVAATVPRGTIRESLAELAGVDLRGVGLTLTRSKRETAVRCAAAVFDAHEGTLTARSLVIDTEPVSIRGDGLISLDTESLDLILRGEPKELRVLRVDAPLLIRGSLRRPQLAIETHAAAVRVIDPGHGKDADCPSLLAHAGDNTPHL